jgi:hypothetical protein
MSQSPSLSLIPLDLPVPPMLEEALGYAGASRWVAFHWSPYGDELQYDDGTLSADGSWHAWLTFVHHRRSAPTLAPYHFGNSEEEAQHWLLLDRETRTLSVGAVGDVQQCLRQAAPPVLTLDTVTALLETIRAHASTPLNLQALVADALQREHQLVTALQAWLDTHS